MMHQRLVHQEVREVGVDEDEVQDDDDVVGGQSDAIRCRCHYDYDYDY